MEKSALHAYVKGILRAADKGIIPMNITKGCQVYNDLKALLDADEPPIPEDSLFKKLATYS